MATTVLVSTWEWINRDTAACLLDRYDGQGTWALPATRPQYLPPADIEPVLAKAGHVSRDSGIAQDERTRTTRGMGQGTSMVER